ncbi:putative retrovirus polyprotein [Aspergillus affinis]|uniref:putative retrovirus polyprotein n=1 Tax=Aspergillus affinis TaxID=1070780 RepID=UPI0022FE0D2D|nr:putative retrovirus polyprotein [Aspergillus affinis]KAI9036268.1 putative retrovirus polyprotein [Aspergillus affinis]
MDFRSCPKDRHGFDETCVIVDHLTKRVISIPCHKNVSAVDMAQLFLENIYRWVELSESILSDRGSQFVSAFWEELCLRLKIKRRLTSGQKPSTNGHTEIVNQYFAQKLRPFVNYYQDNWSELLPAMDFAYAILEHESTGLSPFQVKRDYELRVSFDWISLSKPRNKPQDQAEARRTARSLEQIWDYTKGQIQLAQAKMKKQADKHRRPVDFRAEDWVYVTTKDWELGRPSRKFGDQWAGPYEIIEQIGYAFKFRLPSTLQVHPVFAPEKLRKVTDLTPMPGQIRDPKPPIEVQGEPEWLVDKILAFRMYNKKLRYRVQWEGHPPDPA